LYILPPPVGAHPAPMAAEDIRIYTFGDARHGVTSILADSRNGRQTLHTRKCFG